MPFVSSVLLLACAVAAAADTVAVQPVRDNTLFEDAGGQLSSGAGAWLFVGRNSLGKIRRALIAFDLPALPADAVLDSAVLSVHVSNVSDPTTHPVRVHRVLAAWGEGASVSTGGGGAPSTPGDATWIHAFYPDVLWPAPGGSYDPTASATRAVADTASYEWSSTVLTDDVRSWMAAPSSNFGWVLVGDESTVQTARRVDSRENPVPGWRPTLTLHYTTGTPTIAESWGRLKALYR